MPYTEPATAEGELVDHLRRDAMWRGERPGWTHNSVAALLLAHGRLFTPTPWPDGGTPPGEPGKCYVEAASWAWASEGELAYVEGFAWDIAWPVEHAWCAGSDGNARDLTWPRPGGAYLGLPVHAEDARRIMCESGPLLHGNGFASDLAVKWCREGVPAELLADVGRPVPAAD